MPKKVFLDGKKGMVAKFLVSLVITLAFVFGTVVVVKNVLGLEDQAAKSFKGFVNEVERFDSSDRTKDGYFLIMNEGNAVLLFTKKERLEFYDETVSQEVIRNAASDGGFTSTTESHYFVSFPETKCKELPCACRCKEFRWEEKKNTLVKGEDKDTYIESEVPCIMQCVKVDADLVSGVVVYRKDKEEPRRAFMSMEKQGKLIRVQEQ